MQLEISLSYLPILGLMTILFSCILGIPFIAVISEIVGKIKQKIFIDKFSKQITGLGNILLIISSVIIGIIIYFFYSKQLLIAYQEKLIIISGCLLLGIILLFAYQFTWKKFKKQKIIHILLGLAGLVSLKCSFWLAVLEGKNWLLSSAQAGKAEINLLPWAALLLWFILISISLAVSACSLYLIARRNRDDFGRDYYRFAMPFCLNWGLFFWILHFAAYALVWLELPNSSIFLTTYPLIAVLTALIVALSWYSISCDSNPMRLKARIVLSFILIWGYLCLAIPFLQQCIEIAQS